MPDEKDLAPEEAEEPQEIKPEKQDWTPIDVSKGSFKNAELFKTGKVRSQLRKELKPILSKASQRGDVINEILKERHSGIGKLELKKGLRELKKQGKITPLQERKLRRRFGAF